MCAMGAALPSATPQPTAAYPVGVGVTCEKGSEWEGITQMLATGCAGELARDADLKVVFQSQCTSDTIRVPYTDLEVQKSHFGLGVVLIDVVVVISFYVFTTVVRSRQLEYIREFKLQSIQMSDFTVRVEGLPEDADYGENDAVLRA